MSVADNYEVKKITSVDDLIRVDIDWPFEGLTELEVWQQSEVTGVLKRYSLGEIAVTEGSDITGEYITVSNGFSESCSTYVGRKTSMTQVYTLAEGAALNPVAFIESLDKVVKLIQEQAGGYDQQSVSSLNPFEIQDKKARAGKVLAFDNNGDPDISISRDDLITLISGAPPALETMLDASDVQLTFTDSTNIEFATSV